MRSFINFVGGMIYAVLVIKIWNTSNLDPVVSFVVPVIIGALAFFVARLISGFVEDFFLEMT